MVAEMLSPRYMALAWKSLGIGTLRDCAFWTVEDESRGVLLIRARRKRIRIARFASEDEMGRGGIYTITSVSSRLHSAVRLLNNTIPYPFPRIQSFFFCRGGGGGEESPPGGTSVMNRPASTPSCRSIIRTRLISAVRRSVDDDSSRLRGLTHIHCSARRSRALASLVQASEDGGADGAFGQTGEENVDGGARV